MKHENAVFHLPIFKQGDDLAKQMREEDTKAALLAYADRLRAAASMVDALAEHADRLKVEHANTHFILVSGPEAMIWELKAQGLLRNDMSDLGLKKRSFRVLRIGDNSYQVFVDGGFGLIIGFDGVRFLSGFDGCITSTDAWLFLTDEDTKALIEALQAAPTGERMNPPSLEATGEGNKDVALVDEDWLEGLVDGSGTVDR